MDVSLRSNVAIHDDCSVWRFTWSDRRKYQNRPNNSQRIKKSACNGYFSKKIASGHIVYTSWNSSIVNAGRDTMCEIWFLIHDKETRRHCETRTEVSWFTTLSEIGRIDPEMNRSYWYDTCFVVVKNNPSCKNQCVQTCRQYVDSHYLSKLQSILDVHCIHPCMSWHLDLWRSSEFDAILPRSKWTPLLSLQSLRRAVIDLRNDCKTYGFPVITRDKVRFMVDWRE